MIFVTVGTQLAFPRLAEYIAALAPEFPDTFFMQSADATLRPIGFSAQPHLTPEEITRAYRTTSLIVGHAGVGTILSAQKYGKPLIILPRRFSFGEHRNDHQVATAMQVKNLPGIAVADDIEQLRNAITSPPVVSLVERISADHIRLIDLVKDFVS